MKKNGEKKTIPTNPIEKRELRSIKVDTDFLSKKHLFDDKKANIHSSESVVNPQMVPRKSN